MKKNISLLRFLFILSIFISLSSFSVYSALTDNLVAYYTFDNNVSGVLAPSLVNNTGLNNATLTDGALFQNGKIGKGVYCDGSNDWVSILDTNDVFDFGSGEWTINYWINNSVTTGGDSPFTRDPTTAAFFAYGLMTQTNAYDFYGSTTGSSWAITATNTIPVQQSKYSMHTISRSGNTIYFYNNATLNSSVSFSGTLSDKNTPFALCRTQNTNFGNLAIDELGVWKGRNLSQAEITQLYNGGNAFNYSNFTITAPPQINITFYNQTPTDVTSTTLFNQNVLIQYNISNRTNMTNAVLQYKVNHNDVCYGYLNGTCYFLNNTYYNSTDYVNGTQIYNWSLGENNFYHTNSYFNFSTVNKSHSSLTFTTAIQLYDIKYINFSLVDNLNYFEAMATGTGALYYCNSSYSIGNPATATTCSQIFNGLMVFNHSHSQFVNHTLFVFSQNSSGYVGNVKATAESHFVFKGNGITLYYINNSIGRVNTSRLSNDNGATYIDNSSNFFLDSHIHQFSLTDDFIYKGCINKSGVFECTSETTERIDESTFPPVGVQVNTPNASTYQQFINITYIISQHPNTPATNNTNVTIYLFNTTNYVKKIWDNRLNTTYYWNTYNDNLSVNTNYYLQFNISDTNNAVTNTESDYFNFSTNSYINVTVKSKWNASISNFSINATDLNTSLFNNYSTTNGVIYVDTIKGNSYNLTVDANGYEIADYVKNAVVNYNNHTFSLYTTNSFNISFYDEVSLALMNGKNISLEIISDSFAENYTTENGTLYFDLVSPDSYVFRYKTIDTTDYPERTYYVVLSDREHIDLNLYLVNTTTEITVNIKDQDDNVVSNAYLKVLRYDIGTNTYTLREIVSTNVEGNAYFSGILNTEFYKFIIEYPLGTEVETTSPDYLRSTTLTLRINLEENPLTTYFNSINTYGTLTYNSATHNFNFYYNDASNTATQGCLYVYRLVGITNTLINSSCTASGTSSGTILLGVINVSGYTYVAQGTVKFGTTEYLLKTLTQTFDTITTAKTKNNFFFLTILLTAILSLLFLWNITIALIITPLPMFLMSLTGMIPINRGVGITLLLIGLTLAVVISKKA